MSCRRHISLHALSVGLLAWLAAACGESTRVGPEEREVPIDAGARPPDAAAGDAGDGLDPVGTWALRKVLVSSARAPIIGATTTTTTTLSRVVISEDGAALWATEDVCGVRLASSSPLAVPSLVPGYPASIGDVTFPVAASPGGLTLSPPIDVRGCRLADPANDPLPTEPGDARLVDDDADGHPGLTVRLQITGLGAQAVYVVQRLDASLRGESFTDERVTGVLDVAMFEQHVIGASDPLLARNQEIAVDRAASRFVLVRVEGTTSCDGIMAAGEATLFGGP